MAQVTGTAQEGSVSLQYQWYLARTNLPLQNVSGSTGIRISGATSSTLSLENIPLGYDTDVYVRITGRCNTVTSTNYNFFIAGAPEILSVESIPARPRIGDDVSLRGVMSNAAFQQNVSFQWYRREANGTNTQITNTGRIEGAQSNVLIIRKVSTDDETAINGGYFLVADGDCGRDTSDLLRIDLPVAGEVTTATVQNQTACVGETVSFTVSASSTVTTATFRYQWYRQDGNNATALNGQNSNVLELTNVTLAQSGNEYFARVEDVDNGATAESNRAMLTVLQAPSITTQPNDVRACAGEELTVTVGANTANAGDVTYTWLFQGQEIITTVGSVTITGNLVTPALSGDYRVVVSNQCGDDSSDVVTVTVVPATSITAQSQDTVINRGDRLELFVTATGEGLSYQWQQDGNDIAGAIAAEYSKDDAQITDGGNYRVIVTGECGTDTSDVIEVVVNPVSVAEHGALQTALLSVAPNPFNDRAVITFSMEVAEQVTITLHSSVGKQVMTLAKNIRYEAGKHTLWLNDQTGTLPSGGYFIVMKTATKTLTLPLNIVK
jgi:hypothetical protein